MDDKADLSLRWAHMPFGTFCHVLAHVYMKKYEEIRKICGCPLFSGAMNKYLGECIVSVFTNKICLNQN